MRPLATVLAVLVAAVGHRAPARSEPAVVR
jgi:hypothetical protein